MADDEWHSQDLDLLWGCRAIAKEIDRNERETYHMLESGMLPVKKVGGRWAADRSVLRKFFRSTMAGVA
jgi:hypothetical protein